MMLSRIRPRLSYANVVATLALFIVLGGGAYATIDRKIGTKDLKKNAVTTKKIKKQAVKAGKIGPRAVRTGKVFDGAITTPKISDDAVSTDKLGDETVTGSKIASEAVSTGKLAPEAVEHGKIGDGQVSLQKLNSQSVAEGFQPRSDILYASVNALGQLQTGNSRGAVNSIRISDPGLYRVVFNRNVSGCAWFPSRSAIGTGIPANGDFLGVGGEANQPNNVRVRIRDNNNALANRSFSLLVVC
jgi:hypothetical protein